MATESHLGAWFKITDDFEYADESKIPWDIFANPKEKEIGDWFNGKFVREDKWTFENWQGWADSRMASCMEDRKCMDVYDLKAIRRIVCRTSRYHGYSQECFFRQQATNCLGEIEETNYVIDLDTIELPSYSKIYSGMITEDIGGDYTYTDLTFNELLDCTVHNCDDKIGLECKKRDKDKPFYTEEYAREILTLKDIRKKLVEKHSKQYST